MIQVMLNLLSNAVKLCDSTNGMVEIALAERDGSPRIDVTMARASARTNTRPSSASSTRWAIR
jgi:signal transduction histidine kinase